MGEIVGIESRRGWYEPTIEEKMDLAEQYGIDVLHYCKDPWAVRHYWMDKRTGDYQRARCNRWECRHCGPRKVSLWRQLVQQAEPTLFLTLTKAGKTVEEARRALTTFMQALRRGSKGRGPNHKGVREAYAVEYFAVLERHEDFERNGFHWHILIKGVDRIPYKEVIVPLWTSAIKGKRTEEEMLRRDYGYSDEEIREIMQGDDEEKKFRRYGWIERVRNNKVIGYVTKYLMKTLSIGERGKKEVQRERMVLVRDEEGYMQGEKQVFMEQVTSKAHRICYSRSFFPEQVAVLRKRLFAGIEHDSGEQGDNGLPVEVQEQEEPSQWVLMERKTDEYVDVNEYKRERYAELAEELQEVSQEDEQAYQRQKQLIVARVSLEVRSLVALERRRLERRVLQEALEDARPLCRRVVSMWAYHRSMLARAG